MVFIRLIPFTFNQINTVGRCDNGIEFADIFATPKAGSVEHYTGIDLGFVVQFFKDDTQLMLQSPERQRVFTVTDQLVVHRFFWPRL